mmetsp:Transcript_37190/g.88783  ORF Transcript_37190/g.88783 Transcript_37190/m.88783 type:complete len:247 (+) Transcript_37190:2038-2778(+)
MEAEGQPADESPGHARQDDPSGYPARSYPGLAHCGDRSPGPKAETYAAIEVVPLCGAGIACVGARAGARAEEQQLYGLELVLALRALAAQGPAPGELLPAAVDVHSQPGLRVLHIPGLVRIIDGGEASRLPAAAGTQEDGLPQGRAGLRPGGVAAGAAQRLLRLELEHPSGQGQGVGRCHAATRAPALTFARESDCIFVHGPGLQALDLQAMGGPHVPPEGQARVSEAQEPGGIDAGDRRSCALCA